MLNDVGDTFLSELQTWHHVATMSRSTNGHRMHCFPDWVFEFPSLGDFQSAAEMILS